MGAARALVRGERRPLGRHLLEDGRTVTRELALALLDEDAERIRAAVGEQTWQAGRPEGTRAVFEHAALGDELPEFPTLVASDLLDRGPAPAASSIAPALLRH